MWRMLPISLVDVRLQSTHETLWVSNRGFQDRTATLKAKVRLLSLLSCASSCLGVFSPCLVSTAVDASESELEVFQGA